MKCKAEDVASDIRLQDEGFVRQQLDCVLDQGPCDDLGATIKRKSKVHQIVTAFLEIFHNQHCIQKYF